MKLVKRTVEINEEDFTPELEVTIRVPIDPLTDGIARNVNVYAELGEKFIDTITEKESKENK